MAERPPCYGSFSANRLAPCCRCPLRGRCANAVEVQGFGILPLPRYPKAVARAVALPTTVDAELVNKALSLCTDAGLVSAGNRVRTAARQTVALVHACAGCVLSVHFPLVPQQRVMEMASALRADVQRVRLPAVKPKRRAKAKLTREETQKLARLAENGSRAICSTPQDAAALILEVALAVYGDTNDA
jgi:hypothetical protein